MRKQSAAAQYRIHTTHMMAHGTTEWTILQSWARSSQKLDTLHSFCSEVFTWVGVSYQASKNTKRFIKWTNRACEIIATWCSAISPLRSALSLHLQIFLHIFLLMLRSPEINKKSFLNAMLMNNIKLGRIFFRCCLSCFLLRYHVFLSPRSSKHKRTIHRIYNDVFEQNYTFSVWLQLFDSSGSQLCATVTLPSRQLNRCILVLSQNHSPTHHQPRSWRHREEVRLHVRVIVSTQSRAAISSIYRRNNLVATLNFI